MPQSIEFLKNYDPELAASMQRELDRQRSNIELIASENFVSPAVLAAMGSVLTNKYAEGYPAHRYYGGCQYVDEVENIARDRVCELFGAEHANVQPHSGAQGIFCPCGVRRHHYGNGFVPRRAPHPRQPG